MALHIAQLRECKVCSLLCSISEEESCLGLLHLWRRDQGPVSTVVWFLGSHKIIRIVPESLQGSLFPSPLPSVQQPWPECSPWTLIPRIWEEAACRRDGRAPLIFFYRGWDWNFRLLTYSIDFQHFATMTETSIFWDLTHALYKRFFKLIRFCYFLRFFLSPGMLTFENPTEMMVNSRLGCRLLLQWCPLPQLSRRCWQAC